jgi:hypothetical protein
MSASFLEFRERKAAERTEAKRLPPWVVEEAYVEVAFRVPVLGEYFFAPRCNKIVVCNAEETQPFAIIEYRGAK